MLRLEGLGVDALSAFPPRTATGANQIKRDEERHPPLKNEPEIMRMEICSAPRGKRVGRATRGREHGQHAARYAESPERPPAGVAHLNPWADGRRDPLLPLSKFIKGPRQ